MRRTFLFLLLAVVGSLVSACSGEAATPACEDPVATTEVELADFEFRPVCVEASTGETLTLMNSGEAPHTYTVSDSDLNANLDAGETAEVSLDGVVAGTTYAVRCTYHPQMVGALRVV